MSTETTKAPLLTPRFVLVVLVGLFYFLALGMLVPVVPKFVAEGLGGNDVAVGIVAGALAFGAIVLRPFAGRLGDRLGRKVLIVGGASIMAVSVALYHLVGNVPVFIIVRILGGVGEAAFFVGAGTMATDLAPVDRRGEALSYWSIAVYGGISFGPLLGAVLLDHAGYSVVWTTATVLAAIAALLGLLLRETMQAQDRPAPDAPRPKLIHRAALAPGTVLFLGLVGLSGFFAFLPLYLPDVGLENAGLVFFVYSIVILTVRITGAKLPDRLGPLLAGTISTGMAAIGLTIIGAVATPAGLFVGVVVLAVGISLLYPALMTLALTGVPENERGSAVGTVSSFFDASNAFGAPLLGGIAALAGYRSAFLAGALCAVAGLVLLRSGIDPRTRAPVDHDAAEAAHEALEPEPPS